MSMPSGRNGKPKQKRSLNRTRILQTAMVLGQRDGVSGITIRKLAQALGVTPMVIYRHFSDKTELLSALLDAYIEDAQVAEHNNSDWQAWIMETCWRMYQAICNHADFLPLLANTTMLGEKAWHVASLFLEKLHDAGLDEQHSRRLFQAMINYLIGAATTRQIVVDDENANEELELRADLEVIMRGMLLSP